MVEAKNILLGLLRQDSYIAHATAQDVISEARGLLPKRVVLQPLQIYRFIAARRLISRFEHLCSSHNQRLVSQEVINQKSFFDNVGGLPLDDQQRQAVLHDEDNCLVIAGAGSGKTLTIVAKVKYLIEQKGVNPKAILPISFTTKSAAALQERIDVKGVNPRTFHKFGLDILCQVEAKRPDLYDGSQLDQLLRKFITDETQNSDYLVRLNSFLQNYLRIPRSQFDFSTHGDYIQYMKDQNFTSYKTAQLPSNGRRTFQHQTVKSIEECMIANFLYFNRIEYDYEVPYEPGASQYGQKKAYKPDFTLKGPFGNVYLEHLGIDRAGNVPKFFAKPHETQAEASRRYSRMAKWKRATHTAQGTVLLETYSYQFSDGSLIAELERNLILAGVVLDPMTQPEIWQAIQEAAPDQVTGFVELTKTFLSLLKSNGHSIENARQLNLAQTNPMLQFRCNIFLDLFEPLYDRYQDYLHQQNQIDFSDMITRATNYIASGDYNCRLQYVIVDEFQDLSFGRYRLLQAIRQQNRFVKFYCVGDDWQSIYRFAGSDMALFRDFEQYFGHTHRALIETTYRFSQPLIGTTSNFILKNPNQTNKSLKSPASFLPSSHSIIESDNFYGNDTAAIIEAIARCQEYGLTPNSTVYIIGRYGFDLKRLVNSDKLFSINQTTGRITYTMPDGEFKHQTLSLQFVTAHKSKGLEADYVIVINCSSGRYGFPCERADDPILDLLLSGADQHPNGEERRLFYVAMTRARRHVVLVIDKYHKSKFIKELQADSGAVVTSCPACRNGDLVLRTGVSGGRSWKFYGCTNYAYGCEYSKPFIADRAELAQ